jgi:hypothetical protein
MKKFAAFLLVLSLGAFAIGCGGTTPPAEGTDTPATDTDGTDTPATDTPATDAPATDAPATDAPAN